MGADKRVGVIDGLTALCPDPRDPTQVIHPMDDILRERIDAIACGYPDEPQPIHPLRLPDTVGHAVQPAAAGARFLYCAWVYIVVSDRTLQIR